MKQLTPIEKYALNYLELFHTPAGPEKEGNGEVRAGGRASGPTTHEGLGFEANSA